MTYLSQRWLNGRLGADLALREGQYLLIPVKAPQADVEVAAIAPVEAPGVGSTAPTPPSAAAPLPTEDKSAAPATRPEPTDLSNEQPQRPTPSRLRMPVQGRIVRPYEKGVSEGIGISAAVGTPVAAADDGTVAAITRDTDQVPILVLRHEGSLLTVYAGVQNITVEKAIASCAAKRLPKCGTRRQVSCTLKCAKVSIASTRSPI